MNGVRGRTMNRREFISGMVAAGAAGGLSAAEGSTATDAAAGQPLKVCVFSDIHYERGFWTNADDPTFLEKQASSGTDFTT